MRLFKKINPSIKASPIMILFTILLPQFLLFVFRLGTYTLIRGSIDEDSALIYIHYLIIPLILTAMAAGLFIWSRKAGGDLPRWSMLIAFSMLTASIVSFLISMDRLLPDGLDDWIVPAGSFLMIQLASVMPGLFYSLICLANIRIFEKTAANLSASMGVLIVVPLSLFAFANAPLWRLPETFVFTVFVGATLIAAFVFLQLLLWLSGCLKHQWLPTVIFALVLPICGLLLNRAIPFPADLQHWGFYALTVANGLVLLWGCHPAAARSKSCGWMTAFSYPFSCYFFFLFLPFLPFSLIAMIAAGAGFLILTPTVLFILHTRQLVGMIREQAGRIGRGRVAIGFLTAFLLVPALYTGRAWMHRQIFLQTLDRVYSASYETAEPLPSPKTAAYVLKQLHAMKAGVYVPILTETYNRIVFNGMVLPDRKIRELDLLLLGGEMDDMDFNTDLSFFSFFTGDWTRNSGRNIRPPSRSVDLTDTACSVDTHEGISEATILLTLQSRNDWQSEYVVDITLPSGVFVSGFDLKIGDEMVPGRLSDRRAALWVYHMIRDRQRRDPGLVVYTAPDRIRLSVFPFGRHEERQCALKLLYPENSLHELWIGEQMIELPGNEPATVRIVTPAGNQAVYLPGHNPRRLPTTVRKLERMELSGTESSPGYCPEWDIKRTLLNYWTSGDKQLTTVPWFVTTTDQPLVRLDGAEYWLPLIPDGAWQEERPEELSVIAMECGTQVRVIPEKLGGLAVFNSSDEIRIYDDGSLLTLTPTVSIGPDSRYAGAIDLFQQWWQTQLHPDLEAEMRSELLGAARAINILIPSTAFLAVETSTQQEALKKAEQKSLKQNKNLAFDEFDSEEEMQSPEPGLLLLVILSLPAIYIIRKRRNGHEIG